MSQQKIIGLIGKLGSGKDTVASFLVGFDWQRIAFSDALYQEASDAYHVSTQVLQARPTKETPLDRLALRHCCDQDFVSVALNALLHEDRSAGIQDNISERLDAPRSPRRILQTWGTEYRRARHGEDYWQIKVAQAIGARPDTNFVITDVRFPNEAQLVRAFGGEIVRVVRTDANGNAHAKSSTSAAGMQHCSETVMDDYPVAREIINREGPDGLVNLGVDVIKTFVLREAEQERDLSEKRPNRMRQSI